MVQNITNQFSRQIQQHFPYNWVQLEVRPLITVSTITIGISQTENWDWPKDFSTNMIIYCLKVGSAWSQFSDNSRPREDTEQLNQFAKEI